MRREASPRSWSGQALVTPLNIPHLRWLPGDDLNATSQLLLLDHYYFISCYRFSREGIEILSVTSSLTLIRNEHLKQVLFFCFLQLFRLQLLLARVLHFTLNFCCQHLIILFFFLVYLSGKMRLFIVLEKL